VPVGEMRLGSQMERHRHAVVGDLGALGNEAIDGIRLVGRRRHQRVEEKLEPLRRIALENVLLRLLKVVTPPQPTSEKVPPFGASGLA